MSNLNEACLMSASIRFLFAKLFPITKTVILILLMTSLSFLCLPASAQTQSAWSKTYTDSDGYGGSIWATDDGGYTVAGMSNGRYLLAKFSSAGEVTWWKTYQEITLISGAIKTSDGGYALTGWVHANHTWTKTPSPIPGWQPIEYGYVKSDAVNFIKTDSAGNMQWSKFLMIDNMSFEVESMAQTVDGGFILAGYSLIPNGGPVNDWTLKIDSQGNIVWSKSLGDDLARSVLPVGGGYLLLTNSKLYKLDGNGGVEWSQSMTAQAVVKASGTSFLILNGSALTKIDSAGIIMQWTKSYALQSVRGCSLGSVTQLSDGGYITCGSVNPTYEGVGWIVKIDSAGNLQWNVTSPLVTGHNSHISSIIEVGSGEYVFVGSFTSIRDTNFSEVWLAKISTSIPPASNALIPEDAKSSPTLTPSQPSLSPSSQSPTPTTATGNQAPDMTLPIAITITAAIVIAIVSIIFYKNRLSNKDSKV